MSKTTKSTKGTKHAGDGYLVRPLTCRAQAIRPATTRAGFSRFAPFVLFVVFLVGCGFRPAAIAADRPPIHLPADERHANYGRGGSCGYAATEDLLVIDGRPELARYVRQRYAGGVTVWPGSEHRSLSDLAEELRLPYDWTAGGRPEAGEAWLQRVSSLGLGAVIAWRYAESDGRWDYRGAHAVTFLGFDADGFAWLVNVNCPAYTWRFDRHEFLEIWRRCGSQGFTFSGRDATKN